MLTSLQFDRSTHSTEEKIPPCNLSSACIHVSVCLFGLLSGGYSTPRIARLYCDFLAGTCVYDGTLEVLWGEARPVEFYWE